MKDMKDSKYHAKEHTHMLHAEVELNNHERTGDGDG